MDDLYTFEPMKSSSIDLDNYSKPPSPKMGRRAVSKSIPDNSNIVEQRKALSSMVSTQPVIQPTDIKTERLIQEASANAKLAEKRAERAGHSVEAEKYKQETDYYSRLAEKRASRGRATPRETEDTVHGNNNNNNYTGNCIGGLPNSNSRGSSPKIEKFGFNNKNVDRIVKGANAEGDTGTYIATYDRVVQETEYEASLEKKRAKKQSVTHTLPNAPIGDSLDLLKERICLTESRGASPEPHISSEPQRPPTEQWRPISRGLR